MNVANEDYLEYGVGGYNESMAYIEDNDFVKGTKNGTPVKLQNNELFIDRLGYFESITKGGTLVNERQNYIAPTSGQTKGTSYTMYHFVCLKLKDIHPFFNSMGICRAFLDFDLDINIGKSVISFTTAATSPNLKALTPTVVNNYLGNTNPIHFNVDGIKSGATDGSQSWWKNGGQSVAQTISFTTTLDVMSDIGTKLYVPIYKLKPSINELYIKDPVRNMKYIDYLYYNQNSIMTGSNINFTISNSLTNAKYLLIVPQLRKNKETPFNSSVLLNGPVSLTNLQINKGGSLFNANLVYNYDMFINFISNINNVNGGNDWLDNQLTYEKWNKIYRLYFFDLTQLNNEKDIAYNLSVQYINNNLLSIDVDYYIFVENELVLNKLNGRIGNVANSQQ
jgi:hypothetical protein